jgi:proteasome activator subunit 4
LALLKAQISEKPTIIKLMDSIMDSIYNEFQTVATEIEYDEGVVEYAENLGLKVTREDIESGKQKRQLKNQENREIYERIIGEIIGYVQQNSLHWRVKLMASSMLYNLMHPKTHYPAMVTQYFTHNLIHDSIEERKIAIKVLTNVMSQQKREHQKIKVDPFALAGLEKKANDELVPGVRGDNDWLQYEVEKVPDCQEAWDQPRFIYKPQGFFGWKREFQVYAPSENQPKLVRNLDEMNEHEQAIYKFMMDDGNLDKFFEYWCLEEKKDRDKFNKGRFYFVKSLFLTFGPMLLDRILGRVEPLITDKTNEAKARCVSEMLAGEYFSMKI